MIILLEHIGDLGRVLGIDYNGKQRFYKYSLKNKGPFLTCGSWVLLIIFLEHIGV